MTITVKTWQNQTLNPEELAHALWNGEPKSLAATIYYLFDIANKSTTPAAERDEKLDLIAEACAQRGLLPHVQDLAHRIAHHKRLKNSN